MVKLGHDLCSWHAIPTDPSGPLAQLVRAGVSYTLGCRFESCRAYHSRAVAAEESLQLFRWSFDAGWVRLGAELPAETATGVHSEWVQARCKTKDLREQVDASERRGTR